jgi:hypothetical protein
VKKENVISAMRNDLTTLKKYLAEANLTYEKKYVKK